MAITIHRGKEDDTPRVSGCLLQDADTHIAACDAYAADAMLLQAYCSAHEWGPQMLVTADGTEYRLVSENDLDATYESVQYLIDEGQERLDACEYGDGWAYYAEETSEWYVCDREDLIDLALMMHNADDDIRRDAYSHWCAGTTLGHPEWTARVCDGIDTSSVWPDAEDWDEKHPTSTAALDALEEWARDEASGVSDYAEGGDLTLYVYGPDGTHQRVIALDSEESEG